MVMADRRSGKPIKLACCNLYKFNSFYTFLSDTMACSHLPLCTVSTIPIVFRWHLSIGQWYLNKTRRLCRKKTSTQPFSPSKKFILTSRWVILFFIFVNVYLLRFSSEIASTRFFLVTSLTGETIRLLLWARPYLYQVQRKRN
jgi:hypothetical protein